MLEIRAVAMAAQVSTTLYTDM